MMRWLVTVFDQLPLISSLELRATFPWLREQNHPRETLISDIRLRLCIPNEQYEKDNLAFWLFPYVKIQIKNT